MALEIPFVRTTACFTKRCTVTPISRGLGKCFNGRGVFHQINTLVPEMLRNRVTKARKIVLSVLTDAVPWRYVEAELQGRFILALEDFLGHGAQPVQHNRVFGDEIADSRDVALGNYKDVLLGRLLERPEGNHVVILVDEFFLLPLRNIVAEYTAFHDTICVPLNASRNDGSFFLRRR